MRKLFITAMLFLGVAAQAGAATFYFSENKINAGVGDSFRVDVLMDSPENVNAVEGKINFPNQLLNISGINDGNSIISLWIERPEFVNGAVSFSGAIPGGFPSKGGKLFSLDFQIKRSGVGSISTENISALLNDGEGSSAIIATKNISLSISEKSTGLSVTKIEDSIPPEKFPLSISADQNIFDGKRFISFTTQDKGSGVASYEVAEQHSLIFQPQPKTWEKISSPYLLKDQELKSWIGIRATDRNGNWREVWIMPKSSVIYRYLLTITGGIIAVIVLVLVLRAKWQR